MNKLVPLRLLGRISAMSTFIENFPMSILDFNYGPTYTVVFDYLIDILKACGISVYDISNRIVETVFGVSENFGFGPNAVYEKIAGMNINEQSKFLQVLEAGTKSIIMALLTSIFSCSAAPVLRTANMDFTKDMRPYYKGLFRENLVIPKNMLNIFGHMDINPLTNAGRLYFDIDGAGDKYYNKQVRTELITFDADTIEVTNADYLSMLYLVFGPGHAEFVANSDLAMSDEIQFRLSKAVSKDIVIKVTYRDSNNTPYSSDFKIYAGDRVSEIFRIYPKDNGGNKCYIDSIQIVGGSENGTGMLITGSDNKKTYLYLSQTESYPVIKFWDDKDNSSLRGLQWGSSTGCGSHTITLSEAQTEEIDIYEYVPSDKNVAKDAVRVKYVPTIVDIDSPDFIVCFEGIDPNTLYRTNDMNAFIWYAANRSASKPQVEVNKTMWDSRIEGRKYGVERKSSEEWNEWYNSKETEFDELKFSGSDKKFPEIYPIIQLRNSGSDFIVQFPAQRYFKPTAKLEDSDFIYNNFRLNSTIYRFNYEYLKNIRIFNPKVILYGMYDALLNGAISAILDFRLNPYMKETETKLSTAIKRFIEMEDAEIDDCYNVFSNEEFDEMLRDMLLSRYNATYTGGEVNRATQHDVEDYIAKIDAINPSSSAVVDTTKIMKVVTEIASTGGEEGTIEYGFDPGMDEGWWKRLIWAIAMPLIKAIFTPQLIMLFLINFQIMGIVSVEDLFNTNQNMVIRLITNKILSMVRSVILYVKDMLIKVLLDLFFEVVLPILEKYGLLTLREKLDYWIELLLESMRTIPIFCNSIPINIFAGGKSLQSIEDVRYAEIVNDQNKPESTGGC